MVSVFTLLIGIAISAVLQAITISQMQVLLGEWGTGSTAIHHGIWALKVGDTYVPPIVLLMGIFLSFVFSIVVGVATYHLLKRLSESPISSTTKGIHSLSELLRRIRMRRKFAGVCPPPCESEIKELNDLMLEIMATDRHITEVRKKLKEAEDIVRFANIKFSETGSRYFDAILHLSKRMGMLAERYDPHIGLHLDRVSTLSQMFAKWMGLMPQRVLEIYAYAYLHDLGKIVIPPEILYKEGPLTDEEWQLIKNHTIFGAKIIGDVPWLETAKNIALYHHENYDGSGYPYGLSGSEIPIEAQIVKLADVYDALREKRVYKSALDHESAMETILKGDGRIMPDHFHPRLLEIFREHEREIRYSYELIDKKHRLGMFDTTSQLLMPKEIQEVLSSREYLPGDMHRSRESY